MSGFVPATKIIGIIVKERLEVVHPAKLSRPDAENVSQFYRDEGSAPNPAQLS